MRGDGSGRPSFLRFLGVCDFSSRLTGQHRDQPAERGETRVLFLQALAQR